MRHISAKSLNQWVVVFPAKEEQIGLGLIDALLQVCQPFGKILLTFIFYSWYLNRNAC